MDGEETKEIQKEVSVVDRIRSINHTFAAGLYRGLARDPTLRPVFPESVREQFEEVAREEIELSNQLLGKQTGSSGTENKE